MPRGTAPRQRSKRAELYQAYIRRIRQQLDTSSKGEGFVVLHNIGPYDHNAFYIPLPSAAEAKLFDNVPDAIDFAREMSMGGYDRTKIARVTGETLHGTDVLLTKVVWRSWQPDAWKRRRL